MVRKSERTAEKAREAFEDGDVVDALMMLVDFADRGVNNHETEGLFKQAIRDEFGDVIPVRDPSDRVLAAIPEHFPDGFWHVACVDYDQAMDVTAALYKRHPTEVFHVDHYPATDDEAGAVTGIAVLIRQLHFDRDTGWWSADVRPDPDVDLREDSSRQARLSADEEV